MTKTYNNRRIGKEGNGLTVKDRSEIRRESPGRDALERLIKDCGERAFQFAFRLSGNSEEAKELVQETYYRLLRNWDRYHASRCQEGLLFCTLRNVFLDTKRRDRRWRTFSLDGRVQVQGAVREDLLPDGDPGALEILVVKEAVESVRQAVSGLGEPHRSVLALRELEGLTYEEIQGVLQVPAGTVRSRIGRARQAFRARAGWRFDRGGK